MSSRTVMWLCITFLLAKLQTTVCRVAGKEAMTEHGQWVGGSRPDEIQWNSIFGKTATTISDVLSSFVGSWIVGAMWTGLNWHWVWEVYYTHTCIDAWVCTDDGILTDITRLSLSGSGCHWFRTCRGWQGVFSGWLPPHKQILHIPRQLSPATSMCLVWSGPLEEAEMAAVLGLGKDGVGSFFHKFQRAGVVLRWHKKIIFRMKQ